MRETIILPLQLLQVFLQLSLTFARERSLQPIFPQRILQTPFFSSTAQGFSENRFESLCLIEQVDGIGFGSSWHSSYKYIIRNRDKIRILLFTQLIFFL